MLRQVLLGVGAVLATASLASASQIITPAGWGSVPGSGAHESGGMFDHQPTWNGTSLVGGDEDFNHSVMGPWDNAGATAYIDFGAGYGSIRIEQIWTHWMLWRPSPAGFPSAEVWWDNDVTSTTLTGPNVASTINFNTKGSDGSAWIWKQDFDYESSPITPQGRYLKIRIPLSSTSDITATTEYAIIGTVVPEPATIGLLGVATLGLLRRRQRSA